jgi:hypothetical protein
LFSNIFNPCSDRPNFTSAYDNMQLDRIGTKDDWLTLPVFCCRLDNGHTEPVCEWIHFSSSGNYQLQDVRWQTSGASDVQSELTVF